MQNTFRKLALASAVAASLFAFGGNASSAPIAQEITDARHEAQIWTTYALSPYLRANDIKISVQSGTATLSGVVEDDVNKQLAREIALGVSGVTKVDNNIQVQADYAPPPAAAERGFGAVIDDASISAAVKSKLLWSKHTDGMSIDVTTLNGHVALVGTADNGEAKALAGRLTHNTRGVVAVDNQLVVTRAEPSAASNAKGAARDVRDSIADSWITSKVKSTFLYSSNVDGTDISVSTAGGIVTLSGKVDSGAERALAIEMAQNVRGVHSVESKALIL